MTDTVIGLWLLGRSGITHMAWPTESRLWIRSARLQNTVIAFSASSSFTLWEEVSFWCLACYPCWWLRNMGWPKRTFVCLGTGSGLGTFVLKLLEDEFPEVCRIVTSVYPTAEDDVITSPYNSILAMKELTEHADCVLPVDNQVSLSWHHSSQTLFAVMYILIKHVKTRCTIFDVNDAKQLCSHVPLPN